MTEKAQAWRGAICHPEIEVAVAIPVTGGHCAAVIDEIEPAGRRDGGKAFAFDVKKGAIPLIATKRSSLADEFAQGGPALAVACNGFVRCSGYDGGTRHDLPPVETSQVSCVFGRDETIRDIEILPAVIVEIGKLGTPGPAPHGDIGCDTRVLEALRRVEKESVSASVSLEAGQRIVRLLVTRAKLALEGDTVAGRGEHVADVGVHAAVAVRVAPGDGHASRKVFRP